MKSKQKFSNPNSTSALDSNFQQQKQLPKQSSKQPQVIGSGDSKFSSKQLASNSRAQVSPKNKKPKLRETILNPKFVIDYQNAKYEGKLRNTQNRSNSKVIKEGLGILMDDQLNFLVSNWKQNRLSGKSALINRYGNYIYGFWNYRLNNPIGPCFIKVKHYLILVRFSETTGKWTMLDSENGDLLLTIDLAKKAVLILKGKMQEGSNSFKCSKTYPLSVVEFLHFSSENEQTNRPIKNSIQQVLQYFANKYNFKMQKHWLSLPYFLNEIYQQHQRKCLKSEEFTINVTKKLIQNLFARSQNNNSNKNNETFENQQYSLSEKDNIVFKEICHTPKNQKQFYSYFGFIGGLGIKFTHYQDKDNSSILNVKSLGNHNVSMKIQDIGGKFYDNNCVEEGNFKTKNTFTYENPIFRQSNKLSAIYNKHHKMETTFINEYFDKNEHSIFKLLELFQPFIEEHVVYIMNQCFVQTTKFNAKDENKELIQKVLFQTKNENTPLATERFFRKQRLPQSKFSQYQVEIEKKSKSKSKTGKSGQKSAKNDGLPQKKALDCLKNKNTELKNRIKKVKYEMEYLPEEGHQNIVILPDNKMLTKIKRHLSTIQNVNRSRYDLQKQRTQLCEQKSRSRSQVSKKSKNGRYYIQKQRLQSPEKKDKTEDSLQFDSKVKKNVKALQRCNGKNDEETLLDRINDRVEFKQKFNYGIQYHVQNESYQQKKSTSKKSPQKNKYNGRERFYTDNELDDVLNDKGTDPSMRKIKRKELYSSYIHSNKKRNENNEEEMLKSQKKVEDAIRAEILGISLEEYQQKKKAQINEQKYLEQRMLSIAAQQSQVQNHYCQQLAEVQLQSRRLEEQIKNFHVRDVQSIMKRNSLELIFNQNQTFGDLNNCVNDLNHSSIRKLSPSLQGSFSKSIPIQLSDEKQHLNSLQKGAFNLRSSIDYCGKPKSESLIQKRMRILQEFKQLNEKQKQKNYQMLRKQEKYKKQNETISARLRNPQILEKPLLQTTHIQYKKLPIFGQRQNRVTVSPLRTMFRNIQNTGTSPGKNQFTSDSSLNYHEIGGRYQQNAQIVQNPYDRIGQMQFYLAKQQKDALHTPRKYFQKNARKYEYYF